MNFPQRANKYMHHLLPRRSTAISLSFSLSMVHSKNRLRRCRKEKEGEGSDQPTRRKHMRLYVTGVEGAKILRCLRKKLKAAGRKALTKELAKLVDNSGISNLIQEQVERLAQERVGSFLANSEPSNLAPKVDANAGLVDNSGQSESRMATIPANSEARLYRLQFQNDMPECLYTCTELKSKDEKDVEIAIFDTVLGCVATSSPWSSAKVEVVVLDGDFCADVQEGRANEAFMEHIVKSRKGKGPLLMGEVVIKLEQGVGRLTNITFTDNSAWRRSGRFRLGLILHQNEVADVGAGMSDLLRVKDRRVKGNEKHHPPRLTEEVHHLEKNSKYGKIHKRLMDNGIITTQQLLQAYYSDPENLRRICKLIEGKRGDAEGTWEAIIKHASECNPGDELYSYDITEQGMELIFNSIFQLRGVYYGGTYCEASALTVEQQSLVQNYKKQAFQNVKSMELFNLPATVASTSDPLQQAFHPSSAYEMASLIRQHPSADKKHHAPSPKDEVYQLDGIDKDGPIHKRLLDSGISTVQQLLRAHFSDSEQLLDLIRSVDGNKKGVAPTAWEATINNAEECHPGDELYCYNAIQEGDRIWPPPRKGGRIWPPRAEGGRIWPPRKNGGRIWPPRKNGGRIWPTVRMTAGTGRRTEMVEGEKNYISKEAGIGPTCAGDGRRRKLRAGGGRRPDERRSKRAAADERSKL